MGMGRTVAAHPSAQSPAIAAVMDVDRRRASDRQPASAMPGCVRVRWLGPGLQCSASAHLAVITPDEPPGASLDKQQGIVGDHQDNAQGWVAILGYRHRHHRRQQPPWTNRPWVMTTAGRESRLGARPDCPRATRPHAPPARVTLPHCAV